MGHGLKIKMSESTLSVKDILNIINNKHVDCINFEECNNDFIKLELETRPRSDINWICPYICEFYIKDEEIDHIICHFTEEEIAKVSREVNEMNDKELYKLMCELFSSKQIFEKYKGETIEERYSANDSKSRRSRRK